MSLCEWMAEREARTLAKGRKTAKDYKRWEVVEIHEGTWCHIEDHKKIKIKKQM